MKPGYLALSDGTKFEGMLFGDTDRIGVGEVVFNTSMYGYQEITTDPSYAGQLLTFTYPHIGNVGANDLDEESRAFFAEGIIIRNLPKLHSNFRAQCSLDDYLKKHKKVGIAGVDTRALVIHLRDNGSQAGAIGFESDLVERARSFGSMEGKNYVREVSCKESYQWNEGIWELSSNSYTKPKFKDSPHVVVLDCGVKRNILRLLVSHGFRVTVVPAYSTASEIKALAPNALFLSNGPGDPATLREIVATVEELYGKLPIFGICLGHQILGQVLRGKTSKLKFGHRGGNHPVKDLTTGKVEITVQNHGFTVLPETLSKEAMVSHINLNDGTLEGIATDTAFSVQYHPEASPGPRDSEYLFKRFRELCQKELT